MTKGNYSLGWVDFRAAAGALAVAVPLFGGLTVGDAYAEGNSTNARRCQKGGWLTLVRSDGTGFASQGECVSYAARRDPGHA